MAAREKWIQNSKHAISGLLIQSRSVHLLKLHSVKQIFKMGHDSGTNQSSGLSSFVPLGSGRSAVVCGRVFEVHYMSIREEITLIAL